MQWAIRPAPEPPADQDWPDPYAFTGSEANTYRLGRHDGEAHGERLGLLLSLVWLVCSSHLLWLPEGRAGGGAA